MRRTDPAGGHRKTCRRFDNVNHAHALTFSCFQRRAFLSKNRSRQWMIDAIELTRSRHGLHLWAYVVMPEHVHILFWPPDASYSISSILTTLKQSVAKRAIRYVTRHAAGFLAQMEDRRTDGSIVHRFWQRGGGYDRNLTEPGTVLAEIEYFHGNPVRRGFCERASDWRWSSATEWERPGSGLLRIDRESVPRGIA